MKVLLIEDEIPAARQLTKLIVAARPTWQICEVLDSVSSAVRWLQHFPAPQLLFMDIQIADGLSFDIFRQVQVPAPVIFTTAYDHYAVQAFKVNAIDYLLKPVEPDDLEKALQKFEQQKTSLPDYSKWATLLEKPTWKERFLVKNGQHFHFLTTQDIALFHSTDGMTQAMQFAGKKFFIEHTLDELEQLLNPSQFFRINRSAMICPTVIRRISNHFNGRLKLELSPSPDDNEVFVSRERVAAFKNWLGG